MNRFASSALVLLAVIVVLLVSSTSPATGVVDSRIAGAGPDQTEAAPDPAEADLEADPDQVMFGPQPEAAEIAPPFGVTTQGEFKDRGWFTSAVSAGIKWSRTQIKWSSVEATQGIYDFTVLVDGHTYDEKLAWYQSESDPNVHIIPIVYVNDNPSWAADTACGPLNAVGRSAFGPFMTALAERYDGDGDYNGDGVVDGPALPRIDYWQLYNEPDIQWTPAQLGYDQGGCWGRHGAEYAQLLRVAWDAVRAANPDAQLGIGGLGSEPNPLCAHLPRVTVNRSSTPTSCRALIIPSPPPTAPLTSWTTS
jgi:hypothetical protein